MNIVLFSMTVLALYIPYSKKTYSFPNLFVLKIDNKEKLFFLNVCSNIILNLFYDFLTILFFHFVKRMNQILTSIWLSYRTKYTKKMFITFIY